MSTGWQRVKDHLSQNLFNYGFNTQQSGQKADYSLGNTLGIAFGPTQALGAGTDEGFASSQTDTTGVYPTTTTRSTPPPTSTGGTAPAPSDGGGSSGPSQAEIDAARRAEEERIRRAEEERIRGKISSGYDTYITGLDDMLNGLDTQRGHMENIQAGQLEQWQTKLGEQRAEGLEDLQGERAKTTANQQSNFNKLAEDLRNQMRAGNIYLGARGAGDSSASNMYSYALGRQGNQIRGDLMAQTAGIQNEINKREGNLNRIYNTEINNAQTEYNNGMSEIARWFAEKQNEVGQMKNQAGLDKNLSLAQLSMDLLNQARTAAQELQDRFAAKQDALDQWAINNSNSINEVKSNLAQLSNYYAPGLTMGKVQGAMGTTSPQSYARPIPGNAPVNDEEEKDLISYFNNPSTRA